MRVTDLDIELQNSIIQVKSGAGGRLPGQMIRTENAMGVPVIGYGPDLARGLVRHIEMQGGLVTTDRQLLLEVVKP